MIKITKELKDTLNSCPHVEKVYFDSEGHYYFNAREHKGELYHRVKDLIVTDRSQKDSKPTRVYEAKPEHKLTDALDRADVLSAAITQEVKPEEAAVVDALQKQIADQAAQMKELQDTIAKLDKKAKEKEVK